MPSGCAPGHRRPGDRWHLDEVYLSINGKLQYLWRAVDQDGEVLDILVQPPPSGFSRPLGDRDVLSSRPPCDRSLTNSPLALHPTTWVLETLTLDMLYANANGTEEPECRSEPQPHENGEQHTSREWQRPA